MKIYFQKEGSNTIVFRTPLLVEKFYYTKVQFVEDHIPLPLELQGSILKALDCACVRLLPQDTFDKKFKDYTVMCLEATNEKA